MLKFQIDNHQAFYTVYKDDVEIGYMVKGSNGCSFRPTNGYVCERAKVGINEYGIPYHYLTAKSQIELAGLI